MERGIEIRRNKVFFWLLFVICAGASLFLFHFESFFALIFLVAAGITMIVAFFVKIRRYINRGKYYDFSNGSWLWSSISEGYVLGFIIRFIVIFVKTMNGLS